MSAFVAPRSLGDVILVPSVSNPQQNIALPGSLEIINFGTAALTRYNNYAVCRGTELSRARHTASAPAGC